jgi:hypothetical protein
MSGLDRAAKEIAEAASHAGQSSADDIARGLGQGADELGDLAGKGATVADKTSGGTSNAGQMGQTNDQLAQQGQQASVTDVWTHADRGLAERQASGQATGMEPLSGLNEAGTGLIATGADFADAAGSFLSDPGAYLEHRVGDVFMQSVKGSEVVRSDIANQFESLFHMGDAKPPQGVLQHIGAGFALLTSIEQLLTMWMAAIPFPAFPAVRVMDYDVGLPHAHSHPPNLIPPAPPVPLPSTGPIMPIPLLSGASRTLINNMPAARCGDMGLGIWCGGFFPMYEVFLGSSSVWIEGARAARLLVDITKHCIFSAPKPSDPPMGPMVGMTINSSANVLIGGVPMPSLVSMLMGGVFGALFKGLAKGLKKVRGALAKGAAEAGEHADDAAKVADDIAEAGDNVADDVADAGDNIADDVADSADTLVDEAPVTAADDVTEEVTAVTRRSDVVLGHAGFADEVLDNVGNSPNMQRQLDEFTANGGTVRQGNPGEGSYYNPGTKEIVIDPANTPAQQTSGLAHELGHATNPNPPPSATSGVSRDEYVNGALRDEAYAQHSSATARNEIVGNGGNDIGSPPGQNSAEYQSISDELQNGAVDHDVAMDDMADLMGQETTSTTGQNYRDYYGNAYDQANGPSNPSNSGTGLAGSNDPTIPDGAPITGGT